MATTYLTHTFGSAGNQKTFTVSMWVKKTTLDATEQLFGQQASSYFRMIFKAANNGIRCYSPTFDLTPSQVFRDVSGWYHVCLQMDTTESVAADRANLYINGVKVTVFDTETYPGLNDDLPVNNAQIHQIGRGASTDYFGGLLSYFYFIDGTAYPASTFGEVDSDTGEWTINTNPTVTMGTNGFLILKNGNTITDQSSNSNDWALGGGTLTNTEDCPSDIFATFNSLYKNNSSFSNGNNTVTSGSSGEFGSASTIGASGTGKYYSEVKWVSGSYPILGICDDISLSAYSNGDLGFGKTGTTGSIALKSNGSWRVNNSDTSYGASFSAGDIIGCALDKSTNKVYFSKNGAWADGSGTWDSTTFNASVGAIDVSSILTGDFWFIGVGTDTGTASTIWSANFGNGYFQTTAISSEGTNASGIGKFEYDVPAGYTAISAKGLNS